jgi:transposase InsO family protein
MKDIGILLLHLLTTIAKLIQPGGGRTLVAENLLLKQQLIIHGRARQRAPNLATSDRTILGFLSLFLNPKRITRAAIIIKPSTLLSFHTAMKKRKYRLLYSSRAGSKPGPKGPSKDVISAIVEMKRRNPRYGCPRIAQQINLAFGLELDKDIVRRVLATHYKPDDTDSGPSWLTTLGHAKDSLWSVDLFRAESITLKTHWIMVVMDQYTRRIIGMAVHAGNVDEPALCRMFIKSASSHNWPNRISTDNDPLYQYHQWRANLRILDIEEIKSLPHVPMSHPFVERLIGSIWRELLDQTAYQHYYNGHRCHAGRNGDTPVPANSDKVVDINSYRWKSHCRGLFQLPAAA